VLIRSRRASVGSIPAPVHSDTDIEQWVEFDAIAKREAWVAVDSEDHVLAVMVLGDGWIDQLYVDPASTGMGWAPAWSNWRSRHRRMASTAS
jgi:hypothetical protein